MRGCVHLSRINSARILTVPRSRRTACASTAGRVHALLAAQRMEAPLFLVQSSWTRGSWPISGAARLSPTARLTRGGAASAASMRQRATP